MSWAWVLGGHPGGAHETSMSLGELGSHLASQPHDPHEQETLKKGYNYEGYTLPIQKDNVTRATSPPHCLRFHYCA